MFGKQRILIVEDEPTIANSLQMVFSQEGYEARASYSAEQAVNLVTDWTPHLAIIDVHLKKMNGVEFAIRLRELCPGCEVVLFTGFNDLSGLLAKAREAGHEFEVIDKPIHPTEMLKMVAGWLSIAEEPGLEIA